MHKRPRLLGPKNRGVVVPTNKNDVPTGDRVKGGWMRRSLGQQAALQHKVQEDVDHAFRFGGQFSEKIIDYLH
jgi:hypothetical protein